MLAFRIFMKVCRQNWGIAFLLLTMCSEFKLSFLIMFFLRKIGFPFGIHHADPIYEFIPHVVDGTQ